MRVPDSYDAPSPKQAHGKPPRLPAGRAKQDMQPTAEIPGNSKGTPTSSRLFAGLTLKAPMRPSAAADGLIADAGSQTAKSNRTDALPVNSADMSSVNPAKIMKGFGVNLEKQRSNGIRLSDWQALCPIEFKHTPVGEDGLETTPKIDAIFALQKLARARSGKVFSTEQIRGAGVALHTLIRASLVGRTHTVANANGFFAFKLGKLMKSNPQFDPINGMLVANRKKSSVTRSEDLASPRQANTQPTLFDRLKDVQDMSLFLQLRGLDAKLRQECEEFCGIPAGIEDFVSHNEEVLKKLPKGALDPRTKETAPSSAPVTVAFTNVVTALEQDRHLANHGHFRLEADGVLSHAADHWGELPGAIAAELLQVLIDPLTDAELARVDEDLPKATAPPVKLDATQTPAKPNPPQTSAPARMPVDDAQTMSTLSSQFDALDSGIENARETMALLDLFDKLPVPDSAPDEDQKMPAKRLPDIV